LFGPAACADVVGAALLAVADDSVDVCFEGVGSALVSDPQPDRAIPTRSPQGDNAGPK
jgi:hypothetical protein